MITLLAFDIRLEPGWAVGAVTIDDPVVDRELLVDADGWPWVPGSSLAGSLRSHLREVDAASATPAQASLELTLMGSRPAAADDERVASPLWLLGTRFAPEGDLATEVAGQTAIDRVRGAAAAGTLRYGRTVSVGGTLTAYGRYDGVLTDEQLETLAGWQPAIGRGRTTGGGRARLVGLRHGTVDLTQPVGLRTWLTYTGPDLVEKVAAKPVPVRAPAGPWLTVELSIEDALLVGDPRPTVAAGPRRRNGQPIVPGTTWKGLFRSRVEYIIRSLRGEDAVCRDTPGCGNCVTCDLFGHKGRRGQLRFRDSRIEAEVTPAARTQVAIDRVTGGAHHGLLFKTQPVTEGRLRLCIDSLAPELAEWVRPAILHVLRDLHDGLIGAGSRVTRGMGTLRLADPDTALMELAPVRLPEVTRRLERDDDG